MPSKNVAKRRNAKKQSGVKNKSGDSTTMTNGASIGLKSDKQKISASEEVKQY